MKCNHCTKEYSSKRKTSKYCSASCRKLAFQDKDFSVPDDAKVSVPKVSVLGGHCHGCGEKQSNEFLCMCYTCIGGGITHESLGLKMCE